MWQFARVLRPLGNGAGMMDEGVKWNCHSTAEALINCQDGWRVEQARLENGAPCCKPGPHFWHLCRRKMLWEWTWAVHERQMVLTILWAVIPREKCSFLHFRDICLQALLSFPEPMSSCGKWLQLCQWERLTSKSNAHSNLLLFLLGCFYYYFDLKVNNFKL